MPKNTGNSIRFHYEVRLLKSQRKGKPWRWDVHVLKPMEGEWPGVYDCRGHMTMKFGYTRTRLGGLYQIGKAMDSLKEKFPIA